MCLQQPLRAGMTVFDLEHLEVAYALPYGSAKDPVNMAGFIASNYLRGDLDFWYSENFPDKVASGLLLDVRSVKEYTAWHISGAVNIPFRELRSRLYEIEKNRPVFISCRVGFRSYLGYRILKRKGFKRVFTLAGGSKTFTCYRLPPQATGKPGVPFVSHAEERMAELPGALNNS